MEMDSQQKALLGRTLLELWIAAHTHDGQTLESARQLAMRAYKVFSEYTGLDAMDGVTNPDVSVTYDDGKPYDPNLELLNKRWYQLTKGTQSTIMSLTGDRRPHPQQN